MLVLLDCVFSPPAIRSRIEKDGGGKMYKKKTIYISFCRLTWRGGRNSRNIQISVLFTGIEKEKKRIFSVIYTFGNKKWIAKSLSYILLSERCRVGRERLDTRRNAAHTTSNSSRPSRLRRRFFDFSLPPIAIHSSI